MKKLFFLLSVLTLSFIILNSSLFIGDIKAQLIKSPKNNSVYKADNMFFLQSISDKGLISTQNVINGNYIIKFYNPADSIKSKTQDSNMINSNKTVLTNDTIKNKGQDSSITKINKPVLKSDTVKILVEKIPALNSITFQPIGLFLLFTNFEYDRAVIRNLSLGIKVTFTALLIRNSLANLSKKEKDRTPIKTLSSFGFGGHFRYYPGNRSIEGFFLGGAIEGIALKFDETKENKSFNQITNTIDTLTTINHRKITLTRIEFEIGSRTKISSGTEGFTIQWTLGAGVGYWNDGQSHGAVPLGSIGFGIGYSF
jgi:hypothetical protein